MTIKIIIFDFDGTIADTHHISLTIANQLAKEFNYQAINQENLEELKNLSSRDVVFRSGVSTLKIPFILRRFTQELSKHIHILKPIAGMPSSLKELKEAGYSIGIVSSNLKDNVLAFLENNQLIEYFDFIYSGSTIFGKHRVINKVIKSQQVEPNQVIYVGDETRDISAAKKSKIKVIAVSWGFNSTKILQEHQPDFLVDSPRELLQVIQIIT